MALSYSNLYEKVVIELYSSFYRSNKNTSFIYILRNKKRLIKAIGAYNIADAILQAEKLVPSLIEEYAKSNRSFLSFPVQQAWDDYLDIPDYTMEELMEIVIEEATDNPYLWIEKTERKIEHDNSSISYIVKIPPFDISQLSCANDERDEEERKCL